ncbi:MAG TPA: hypothetical protein VFT64_04335 [Rickettsiales bacterium]|nr:hypothetical protein [Rickettsiales bacterium]
MPSIHYFLTLGVFYVFIAFAFNVYVGVNGMNNIRRKNALILYAFGALLAFGAMIQMANQAREADEQKNQYEYIRGQFKTISDKIQNIQISGVPVSGGYGEAIAKLDEIKTQIDNLLIPKPPRHLTDVEKTCLSHSPVVDTLKTLKISAPSDGEAQSYASEFMEMFNTIGIKVDRVGFIIPTSVESYGVMIAVHDLKAVPPLANTLAESLQNCGIDVKGSIMTTLGNNDFQLVIGTKK